MGPGQRPHCRWSWAIFLHIIFVVVIIDGSCALKPPKQSRHLETILRNLHQFLPAKRFLSLRDLVTSLLDSEDDDYIVNQYAEWIHQYRSESREEEGEADHSPSSSRRRPPRILFLHHYKTGGSTINQILGKLCYSLRFKCLEVNLFQDHAVDVNEHVIKSWNETMKSLWTRKWKTAQAIWGHWWYPTTPEMSTLMPIDPTRDLIITVLRDPLLTELSSLYYQISLGNQRGSWAFGDHLG